MDREILWGFIRVIVVLAIFLPLIYFVTRWYAGLQVKNSSLIIKERVSLGNNKFLYIVEWENQQFFLAATAQQVTLISTQSLNQTDDGGKVESSDSDTFK